MVSDGPTTRLGEYSSLADYEILSEPTVIPVPRSATREWRWLRRNRALLLVVALPTLLAVLYFGVFASDIYESQSRFVIKAPDQKSPQIASIANLIQTNGISAAQEQSQEVIDYVRSRNGLNDLAARIDVRQRFSSPAADVFSRFPQPLRDGRFENLYKFYRNMVAIDTDHDTGSVVLTVKAFTPDDARDMNARLLDLSEAMVNRLNGRAQNQAIAEAEKHVAVAEDRARKTAQALRQYRNAAEIVDPEKQAAGVLEISNSLIGQQAALSAQLQSIERVAPRNPAIGALRQRIAALQGQIAAQTGRATGTSNGLANKMTPYDDLTLSNKFAVDALTAAQASLESARTDARRQQFYLERIVTPDRPDVAAYPKRILSVLVVFAAAVALYLIGWMLIVGILEHAPDET